MHLQVRSLAVACALRSDRLRCPLGLAAPRSPAPALMAVCFCDHRPKNGYVQRDAPLRRLGGRDLLLGLAAERQLPERGRFCRNLLQGRALLQGSSRPLALRRPRQGATKEEDRPQRTPAKATRMNPFSPSDPSPQSARAWSGNLGSLAAASSATRPEVTVPQHNVARPPRFGSGPRSLPATGRTAAARGRPAPGPGVHGAVGVVGVRCVPPAWQRLGRPEQATRGCPAIVFLENNSPASSHFRPFVHHYHRRSLAVASPAVAAPCDGGDRGGVRSPSR
jgi:hypothetical protein